MENFYHKLRILFADKGLLKKIGFVLIALVLFRVLSSIPIPGIDTAQLGQFLANNQFLGVLNIFSGGGLSNLSIAMLGVGPYITASIIMQLSTMMFPRLKALYHEEGEAGRQKFTLYSRLLTLPLALVQGFAILSLLENQGAISSLGLFEKLFNIVIIATGSILVMWIGELISEYGIGNGISILIFAGIVASLPTQVSQLVFSFDVSQIPLYAGFILVALLIILGVVIINEAERPVPVTYAKHFQGTSARGGGSTFIPLKINQAGVMPIIFALSILLFPQMLGNLLSGSESSILQSISSFMLYIVETQWLYAVVYFALVFIFTYFYTAITFDPESMASNLQKSGAFVSGIRPGNQTALYIGKIVGNITFIGALFLGVIAVLPILMQVITGVTTLAIGGTALLIVVSVVIDLIKKIDGELTMREY